jgi:hypothetical protein
MTKPTSYDDVLGRRIASRMATGEPLISICADEDMPALPVAMNWINDPERSGFGAFIREAFSERLEMALADNDVGPPYSRENDIENPLN